MDHLRCKTPHRVRNEFYLHLVAYNLIRQLMAVAAFQAEVEPWTVSFKGALQMTIPHAIRNEMFACLWVSATLRLAVRMAGEVLASTQGGGAWLGCGSS